MKKKLNLFDQFIKFIKGIRKKYIPNKKKTLCCDDNKKRNALPINSPKWLVDLYNWQNS